MLIQRYRIGFGLLTLVVAALLLQGCAFYRVQNNPVEGMTDPLQGYRLMHPQRDYGDVLLLMSFSGGGTRAAAFSYGALKTLRDTSIGEGAGKWRLLDEVDLISSVSGGSFTAAYYGLHGDGIFQDYENRFLKQSIQGALIRKLLNPLFWTRSIFTGFDRTEMAVEYYDTYIFGGATFADIFHHDRPYIEINATDLSSGQRFSFTQRYFDLLCSDLQNFPLARAVTASSAVPIVFPTVVLKNYSSGCDPTDTPTWKMLDEAPTASPAAFALTRNLRTYRDEGTRSYIHLVDGGISDNLGLRSITDHFALVGLDTEDEDPFSQFETVAIFLINAETKPKRGIDDRLSKPGVSKTLDAVSSAQIALYNQETLATLHRYIEKINGRSERVTGRKKVYFIEINFQEIASPKLRDRFNALPTSLALNAGEIDELVLTADRLLRQEPAFQELVDHLNKTQTRRLPTAAMPGR